MKNIVLMILALAMIGFMTPMANAAIGDCGKAPVVELQGGLAAVYIQQDQVREYAAPALQLEATKTIRQLETAIRVHRDRRQQLNVGYEILIVDAWNANASAPTVCYAVAAPEYVPRL